MSAEAAHDDHHAHHHEMPTEGGALTGVAVSATLHCLTGCAIGEITGVALGTALGLGNFETIVLAVALAFVFGYSLTSLPLLRAGLALGAVIPIALASDTLSIATMEVIDNVVMVVIPGAMDAGLGDLLFWGSLSFALAVAFVFAVPVNRWLISKGKGHAAVHETGIHGGPSPRLVGVVLSVAAVFGTTVLVAEAIVNEDDDTHGSSMAMEMGEDDHGAGHDESMAMATPAAGVPGVAVAEDGLRLTLEDDGLAAGKPQELRFEVVDAEGSPITDFDVEHERELHLIVVRRDMSGFQHLHPRMSAEGTWSTPIELAEPGSYRVFADFAHEGTAITLGADLAVDGRAEYRPLPPQLTEAELPGGYGVGIQGAAPAPGAESELAFRVVRDGRPIATQEYLGAAGHLVALREGDLAFLHVHPVTEAGESGPVRFMAEFPSAGRYRLFFQFKDGGEVHTAEFTRVVE